MTCHDAREQLSAPLDEGLEADRRVEVEAHLAGCAECRFELDRLRATVDALHGLERPRAPIGFVDRVMERVQPVPWYRRLGARLFLPLSVKLPAGAAAVVVIAGLAILILERTPEFRDAARPHSATPSAPSTVPHAPLQTPPPSAPAETVRPPKPPRARPEERPPSSAAPTVPEAPVAPAETTASTPPAPEAKVESEAREQPAPPFLAPPTSAAQADRSEFRARSAPQEVRRALAPVSQADLAGRLIVRDRDLGTAAVVALLSTIGGRETARHQDAADTVIDVQVPAARYDEFVERLGTFGSWTTAGRANVLPLDPPQIRMTIRVTGVRSSAPR